MIETSVLEARTLMLNFVPIVPVSNALSAGMVFSSIFFLILAWLATALRLYTRLILRSISSWDDWTGLFSLVRVQIFHLYMYLLSTPQVLYTGYEACIFVIIRLIPANTVLISARVMTLTTNVSKYFEAQ
jgi:hypothetical protein